MEVAQHIETNTVRCIMLAASEGLMHRYGGYCRGQAVSSSGRKKTLGDCLTCWEIHRRRRNR